MAFTVRRQTAPGEPRVVPVGAAGLPSAFTVSFSGLEGGGRIRVRAEVRGRTERGAARADLQVTQVLVDFVQDARTDGARAAPAGAPPQAVDDLLNAFGGIRRLLEHAVADAVLHDRPYSRLKTNWRWTQREYAAAVRALDRAAPASSRLGRARLARLIYDRYDALKGVGVTQPKRVLRVQLARAGRPMTLQEIKDLVDRGRGLSDQARRDGHHER